MCRISIFVPKNTVSKTQLLPFLDMVELNGQSNKDGVGFAFLDGINSQLYKKSKEASEVFCMPELYAFLSSYASQAIMAHVRLSTTDKGKNDDKNAHPFEFETIIGVHNGHFNNYNEIKEKYKLPAEITVDSEVFFYRLNQVNVERNANKPLTLDIIQSVIDEFTGSFAVAIYDKIENNIWLLPGTNDLHLFDIGYAYIVNTTPTVDKYLEYGLLRNRFCTGNESTTPVSPIKINNDTAFIINKDGLHEVGKFTYTKYTYQTTDYSRFIGNTDTRTYNHDKQINLREQYQIFCEKRKLIDKYGLGWRGIIDLCNTLDYYPTLAALKIDQIKELDTFIQWLIDNNKVETNNFSKHAEIWDTIYTLTTNEYDFVGEQIPDFKKPFWMNPLTVLQSIKIPDEIMPN